MTNSRMFLCLSLDVLQALRIAPDVLKAMYDQAVMFKAFNH